MNERVPDALSQTADALTTFADNGRTSDTIKAPLLDVLEGTDPYQTSDLRDVLSRNYRIGSFNLAYTDTAGLSKLTIAFPEVMFTLPFISDKVRDYMLFRCKGVKLSFRFNTTKFSFGTFLVHFVPFYKHTVTDAAFRHVTLPAASQCDGTVFSVAQGQAGEMEIPWIMPKAYVRIAQAGVTQFAYGGTLFVRVLNPLRSAMSTAPPNVNVSVYANFIDPVVCGPSPDAHASAQSNMTVKEAEDKSDVFTGVKEAVSTVTGLIGAASKFGERLGGDLGKVLPHIASLGFDKPNMVSSPQLNSLDVDTFTQIYGKGLDTSAKAAIDPANNISVDPRTLGVDNGSPTLLDIMKRPTLVRQYEFKNTSITPGEFSTRLINNPVFWMKIAEIAGPPDKQWWHPTYMAHYARWFKHWRGGLKWYFDFRTSPMVTARVRIAHFPEQRSWTEPVDDYAGDMVSKVIDIAGDTGVSFAIPWLTDDHWKPLDIDVVQSTANSNGLVALCFENYINGPEGASNDVSIFLNVWLAADDDLQFMQYRSFNYNMTPEYTVSAQSNMHVIFKDKFEGLRPATKQPEFGYMVGERMGPVQDYLHRYAWGASISNGTPQQTLDAGFKWWNQYDSHEAFLAPFLFWRGATRVRVPATSGQQNPSLEIYPGDFSEGYFDQHMNGLARRSTFNQTPALEIPWYMPVMFREVSPTQFPNATNPVVLDSSQGPSGPATWSQPVLRAAGDDFIVGPVSACPQWSRSVVPETTTESESSDPKKKGKFTSKV
jgi:hypothetical protein